MVNLALTMFFEHESGLSFILNEDNFTAEIISSPKAKGNIIVPNSINFNSREYFITKINEESFSKNRSISSLQFSDDSKLYSIGQYAFGNSFLISLSLPASVEDLQEGWCNAALKLNKISIAKQNKRYKIINDNIVIGKSDVNSEKYDHIVFACRNIKQCLVPPYIKHINSYSFKDCHNLISIDFTKDSELNSIGTESFSMSVISSISIPDHVHSIGEGSFSLCRQLKTVTFSKSSELKRIGRMAFLFSSIEEITLPASVNFIGSSAFSRCRQLRNFEFSEGSEIRQFEAGTFYDTSIQNLHIPSKVEILKGGWCSGLIKLSNILLSPENPNFSYLSEKCVLGKSSLTQNAFDVIVFACRDMEEFVVPSYIKSIGCYAFELCKKLEKIEFEKNSELTLIETKAFADSSLQTITIPFTVKHIECGAFFGCNKLKEINFFDNCELNIIDEFAFAYSAVESLAIPEKVAKIEKNTFLDCNKLIAIEFLGNPEFQLDNLLMDAKKITLVSFPNSNQICFRKNEKISFSNFRLFTRVGTKIIDK